MRKHKLFISLMLLFNINSFAEMSSSQDGSNKTTTNKTEAVSALCAPPSASIELSLNNVRTTIHSGGDMWWDLIGNARYEIPKGSGKHSLYAGSLWMGGIDDGGNLKVAAVRFRQVGNDFWPGPLTENSASIDAETCAKYGKHFKISRAEVEQFVAWYTCSADPDCDAAAEFPGYVIPASIINWPGNGFWRWAAAEANI